MQAHIIVVKHESGEYIAGVSLQENVPTNVAVSLRQKDTETDEEFLIRAQQEADFLTNRNLSRR